MRIIENIILKLLGGDAIEQKLLRCQNYNSSSIIDWKEQTDLNWCQTIKVLKAIEIFDASRIRGIITKIVNENIDLFSKQNLFITSFGSEGKSGGKIAYEFRHTKLIKQNQFINAWELSKLPQDSTIIFVEDLIGTGTQSTEYILNKLNLLLNPSSIPYLFTICATPEGIEKISNETNFKVLNGIELTEKKYQHYSDENKYFNKKEKKKLISLNSALKIVGRKDFDRGLLITFFYSPPNNSMPFLWKDKFLFKNAKGIQKEWKALLPREY